jgi:hypothetical protein
LFMRRFVGLRIVPLLSRGGERLGPLCEDEPAR